MTAPPETAAAAVLDISRPRSPERGRRRNQGLDGAILAATIDVLVDSGYDGTTIQRVAARARSGRAVIYRRWLTKADLVLAPSTLLTAERIASSSPRDRLASR